MDASLKLERILRRVIPYTCQFHCFDGRIQFLSITTFSVEWPHRLISGPSSLKAHVMWGQSVQAWRAQGVQNTLYSQCRHSPRVPRSSPSTPTVLFIKMWAATRIHGDPCPAGTLSSSNKCCSPYWGLPCLIPNWNFSLSYEEYWYRNPTYK